MADYEVYFANAGVPEEGLTVTWEYLKERDSGANEGSPPSFTEVGGGWYRFSYSPSETMVGVIDGSATLDDADRYVPCKFTTNDESLDAAISTRSTVTTAQVNTECDNAIADYDPPTKAELDSGLAGLNDVSSADVNAACDTALSDYDGPTNAEMEARTLLSDNYATASALAIIDAIVDKLDTTLVLNGATYRFTSDSLYNSPSGGINPNTTVDGDITWAIAMKLLVASAFAGGGDLNADDELTFNDQNGAPFFTIKKTGNSITVKLAAS